MRLVIISRTPHHRHPNGEIVGHGATVRELSYLSTLFDDVRHIADLHAGDPPASEFAYETDNVEIIPVTPGGGNTIKSKIDLLFMLPNYIRLMLRELRHADVVHVRCPAGISLYAIVLLALLTKPKKRWVKYAGNWKADRPESKFYTFQKWWLQNNFCRAQVTVNGEWDDQPPHITTFMNPSLTAEQIEQGKNAASRKSLDGQVRLLFVGNVNTPKGVGRAVEVLPYLKEAGCDFHFDIIGDGPERKDFEAHAAELGVAEHITFHGWMSRDEIDDFYAQAHIMLFPTDSEGWPKVLSEAMAYGVVPVVGAVSTIPMYLESFGTGKSVTPTDIQSFANAIINYTQNPDTWKRDSEIGLQAANQFTYASYLEAVRNLLEL